MLTEMGKYVCMFHFIQRFFLNCTRVKRLSLQDNHIRKLPRNLVCCLDSLIVCNLTVTYVSIFKSSHFYLLSQ